MLARSDAARLASSISLIAQRYDANGVALGGEFRVNTTTQDDQMAPSIAMGADGTFVIAWQSHNQDGSGWGVYAQRYSSIGVAQGGEFQVNSTTVNDQMAPTAAMAADGSFVVTWQSNNQDGDSWGVYAQRYGADEELNLSGGEGDVFSVTHQSARLPAGLAAPTAQFRGSETHASIGAPPALQTAGVQQVLNAFSSMPLFIWSCSPSVVQDPVYRMKAAASGELSEAISLHRPVADVPKLVPTLFALDCGGWAEVAPRGEVILPGGEEQPRQEGPAPNRPFFPLMAPPAESGSEEDIAVTKWQRACDACFMSETTSVQESSAPISGSLMLGGCIALLGGFLGIGMNPVRRHGLRPIPRPLGRERRRSPRYPCYLNAHCRQVGTDVTECRSAVAGNLSTGGVNLLLSHPFLPGSLLILELEGAGQDTPRWVMIWVLRVTEQVPGTWVLGCTFERQLTQEELQNLLLVTTAL